MLNFKSWLNSEEVNEGLWDTAKTFVGNKISDKFNDYHYKAVKPKVQEYLSKLGLDKVFPLLPPDQSSLLKRNAEDALAHMLVSRLYGGIMIMRSDIEIIWNLLNKKLPSQDGGTDTMARINGIKRPLQIVEQLPRNPRIKFQIHPDAVNWGLHVEREKEDQRKERILARREKNSTSNQGSTTTTTTHTNVPANLTKADECLAELGIIWDKLGIPKNTHIIKFDFSGGPGRIKSLLMTLKNRYPSINIDKSLINDLFNYFKLYIKALANEPNPPKIDKEFIESWGL
jgi:hypothetical protein